MMNINKCISCKHYEPFFSSCGLYDEEAYIGEGDFEIRPVSIRSVSWLECEYEQKEVNNDR